MLLDNKRRNLWTLSAKERRSPELTAAMTLKSYGEIAALFKYETAYLGGIILEKSLLFY